MIGNRVARSSIKLNRYRGQGGELGGGDSGGGVGDFVKQRALTDRGKSDQYDPRV